MNNSATYFKYSVLLIIVLACLWFARSCSGTGSGNNNDTVSVKHDTQWLKHSDSLVYQPVPYAVFYKDKIVFHDTLETTEFVNLKVDSARILAQYFATRKYDTTINVQYGKLNIKDTVTQNRITGRSLTLNQSVPVITNTITLKQPKRVIFYVGAEVMGNITNLPYATGIDLGLKFKNDYMFEIGGLLTKTDPMYKISFKFPVKFRKQ